MLPVSLISFVVLALPGAHIHRRRALQNNAELVPFFLAGLCHPTPGVKILTAKALIALGLGGGGGGGSIGERKPEEEEGERADRCRALLQPPLLPALVAALGDADTGAAQARAFVCCFFCHIIWTCGSAAHLASPSKNQINPRLGCFLIGGTLGVQEYLAIYFVHNIQQQFVWY